MGAVRMRNQQFARIFNGDDPFMNIQNLQQVVQKSRFTGRSRTADQNMIAALDAEQQPFIRIFRILDRFQRIDLMKLFPLLQTVVAQAESHVVAVHADGKRNAAGQIFFVIHHVFAANGRKTVFAGNAGINHRTAGNRIKRNFIGVGDNIKQIGQIFLRQLFILVHHPGIGAFAAQAQPDLTGAVDCHFFDIVLIVPV